jgi:hypothetical protein
MEAARRASELLADLPVGPFRDWATERCRIQIVGHTAYYPDPPRLVADADGGAGFLLSVRDGGLRYYSAPSCVARRIDLDVHLQLLRLAEAVVDEGDASVPGADTAVGRRVTWLDLEVALAGAERAQFSFSHFATPAGLEHPAWGALLSFCAGQLTPDLADPERDRWEFLLEQFQAPASRPRA